MQENDPESQLTTERKGEVACEITSGSDHSGAGTVTCELYGIEQALLTGDKQILPVDTGYGTKDAERKRHEWLCSRAGSMKEIMSEV